MQIGDIVEVINEGPHHGKVGSVAEIFIEDRQVTINFGDHYLVFLADDVEIYVPEVEEHDQFLTDAEADADVLRSAGWGTDEDYGHFGDPYDHDYGY